MQQQVPKSEKSANLILGIFLIVLGIISVMLNFVLLPLIGVILGIPCIGLGIFFVVRHRRRLSGAGAPSKEQKQ